MLFNGSAITILSPLLHRIPPHCTYQPGVRDKQCDVPWIISVAAPHDATAAESMGKEADLQVSTPG